MMSKDICAGCKKPIGPRQGYRFTGEVYYHADNRRDCEFPEQVPPLDPDRIKVGQDINCRGRNGFFKAKEVEVWVGVYDACISVFSKQAYGRAPLQIAGARKDITAFLDSVIQRLKEREDV